MPLGPVICSADKVFIVRMAGDNEYAPVSNFCG